LSPAKPHLTNPVPLSTTSGFSVIPDAVYALTKHEGEGKAPAKDVCRPRTWLASHEQKQKSSKENSKKEPYISVPSFFGGKNGPFHSESGVSECKGMSCIPFRARKRRVAEEVHHVKAPSERIVKRQLLAASLTILGESSHPRAEAQTPRASVPADGNGRARTASEESEHNPGQPDQDDGTSQDDPWPASSRLAVDRQGILGRLKAPRGLRENAGNSLVALRESGAQAVQEVWEVQATSFELHTPQLIRRQVHVFGLSCLPSAFCCKACLKDRLSFLWPMQICSCATVPCDRVVSGGSMRVRASACRMKLLYACT